MVHQSIFNPLYNIFLAVHVHKWHKSPPLIQKNGILLLRLLHSVHDIRHNTLKSVNIEFD